MEAFQNYNWYLFYCKDEVIHLTDFIRLVSTKQRTKRLVMRVLFLSRMLLSRNSSMSELKRLHLCKEIGNNLTRGTQTRIKGNKPIFVPAKMPRLVLQLSVFPPFKRLIVVQVCGADVSHLSGIVHNATAYSIPVELLMSQPFKLWPFNGSQERSGCVLLDWVLLCRQFSHW